MPGPDIRLQGSAGDNNTTCIITISLCNHSPTPEHKLLSSTRMCMDYVTASQMRDVGVLQMTLSCVMSAGAVCQIFHVPQRALCPALVIKTSPPSHSPYNTPTPGLAHSAASLLSLLSDPAQISRVIVRNPQSPTRNFISKFHQFSFKKKMNIFLNHASSSRCQGIRF